MKKATITAPLGVFAAFALAADTTTSVGAFDEIEAAAAAADALEMWGAAGHVDSEMDFGEPGFVRTPRITAAASETGGGGTGSR